MRKRTHLRYSEAFKLQVVSDYEAGKYSSISEASKCNGIKGCGTIANWLIQYKKDHLMPRKVLVQKPEELTEVQRLKAEVDQLKNTVCHLSNKNVMLESTFETVCEMYSLGAKEEVAKKLESQVFDQQSKKKK